MANLIITVIAIALVAIATLMGAYYGGSAFLNNEDVANASTMLNQGQQMAGAWSAYEAAAINGGTPPVNTGSLVPNYITAMPASPNVGGATTTQYYIGSVTAGANVGSYYLFGDGGTKANLCNAILKAALGAAPAAIPSAADPSALVTSNTAGNGTFGCGTVTSNVNVGNRLPGTATGIPTVGHNLVFYRLGQ